MRRNYIIIVYVVILLSVSVAVGAIPLDLIIMVDTSESMEAYFDDLVHFLITGIIEKNLQKGDVFHLIRFSDRPVHEMTQTITGTESIKAIERELYFLKQKLLFGRYTDLVEAIRFTIEYAEGLTTQNNKKMLLLTDGIHEPPPESRFAHMDPESVKAEVKKYAQSIIRKNGWSVHILRIPLNGTAVDVQKSDEVVKDREHVASGTRDDTGDETKVRPEPSGDTEGGDEKIKGDDSILDIFSDNTDSTIVDYNKEEKSDLPYKSGGFPRLEFPGDLGRQGTIIAIPFHIENFQHRDIIIKLVSLETHGRNILHGSVSPKRVPANTRVPFRVRIKLPPDFPKGPAELPISLTFGDDNRISPREGVIGFYYTGDVGVNFMPFVIENFQCILIILIIIALLVILFVFIRKRIFEGIFSDFIRPAEWGERAKPGFIEGDTLIEMRVSFQNPHIGFRNIHKIDENKRLSVGGGLSSFLVFLIPVPSHIAEISCENGVYVFTPIREELFPDLSGPVKNCLNKEIPLVSSHNYRTYLVFTRYESPLLKLNRILHSVEQ
ncbi:MAG: VWA domain-containing protein [Spirochaetales bacterium]|nr:VWA domain-containing protein [Spirochaetales bacterium]